MVGDTFTKPLGYSSFTKHRNAVLNVKPKDGRAPGEEEG
jgi:hypothetical protein